jgi:phytoene synthase
VKGTNQQSAQTRVSFRSKYIIIYHPLNCEERRTKKTFKMKLSFVAWMAFLTSTAHVDAFVTPSANFIGSGEVNQRRALHSLATRSEDEEKVAGKVLEGGKVIDFESTRGPSLSEDALRLAKEEVANGAVKHAQLSDSILGINDDVIAEVGHELGLFATSDEIQKCAAYLRSKAANGFFEKRPGSISETYDDIMRSASVAPEQIGSLKNMLAKAFVESGEVTSAYAKTFYLGTQIMPEDKRQAIWAIYVWCRRTDEIVDAPRDNNSEMLSDLAVWEMRLENLWKYGEVEDVFDLCLLDVLVKYPTLPITPFADMVRGMLMDVPDLGTEIYDTFDDLHLYCYRVAGTVGLMCLPVFGCASGYDEIMSKEPALSLGVALQLTNILRDVGEDATTRNRVYLPVEDMKRFGVTKEQIYEQRVDQNYINMMKFQIERARMYYERARRGVFMLSEEARLPVQTALDAYGKILEKIEENGYDTLKTRAYVDKWEKLSIIPFSWYRTQDISRTVPLPGDKQIPSLEEPAP